MQRYRAIAWLRPRSGHLVVSAESVETHEPPDNNGAGHRQESRHTFRQLRVASGVERQLGVTRSVPALLAESGRLG